MNNTKRLSVSENMLWNSIGSLIYLFSQWLLTIIIVHLSGYGDAGIFSLAMSLTNMFYCIAVYGIRNYQVSDIKNKYNAGIYILSRIITCVIALIVCAGFIVINSYNSKTSLAVMLYMVFKISEAFVDVFHGIDQKLWRMDIIGKSFIIRAFSTFALFIATLYLSENLCASIAMMAIGGYFGIIVYDIPQSYKLENFKIDLRFEFVSKLLWECLPLVIYLFLSTSLSTIPRYFLEKFYSNEVLGIYASIATPAVIVQVAASYFFNPFITLFAEKYNKHQLNEFVRLFKKCMFVILLLSIAAIIGAEIFGDFGLRLLFGESILQHSYLLTPIIICTILTAIVWFLCTLLTVIREFKGLIISNVLAVLICVISSLALIPQLAMNGVNIVMIISLGVEILFLIIFGVLNLYRYIK
ncbi:lipopolysaccharide biosynthesis protein [Eubacterium limosum]|uniref:lipopolysaccharide biosynthesis protein n=1 Tax=Eubacterium limosum TaxID=1736 RepID=UPI003716B626